MALSLTKRAAPLFAAVALLVGLSIQIGRTNSFALPSAVARSALTQAGSQASCAVGARVRFANAEPTEPYTPMRHQATHVGEPTEAQGEITGKVTDLETSAPVAEVVVNLYDSWGNIAYQAVTDAAGDYVASGLAPGSYQVEFLPAGFSSAYRIGYYHQQAELAAADWVRVENAQTMHNIDARLVLGGVIRGCVGAAEDGAPLAKVSVEAYDLNKTLVALTSTDQTGGYTLSGLPLGSYRLKFSPYDHSAAYIAEYYVDQFTWEAATTIVLTATQRQREIHAMLVYGGSIHGRVRSEDQQPLLTNVTVSLLDDAGRELRHTQIDAEGYYTFTALATGLYYLAFAPFGPAAIYVAEYYGNQRDLETATPLSLTAPEVLTGVDEQLARGSTISGEVTNRETGAPLSDVTILLYDTDGSMVRTILPNNSGVYTLTGVASGDYRIGFLPFGHAASFVAEYYQGKSELALADPLALGMLSNLTGIDAALLLATPTPTITLTIQPTSPPETSPTLTPVLTPTPDGPTITVQPRLYLPLVQR